MGGKMMGFIVRKAIPSSVALIIALSAVLAAMPAQPALAVSCPTTSSRTYKIGTMRRYQQDYKRPAYNHPDKTLYMRGPKSASGTLGFVNFGKTQDKKAPQLATLFQPTRVPKFTALYKVPQWNWGTPPQPGSALSTFETHALPSGYSGNNVTVLGVQTTPGELLRSPTSGYNLGSPWGKGAAILYADSTNDHAITLHFTREDSIAKGYSVQIQGVCVDPNLLKAYNARDVWNSGARYTKKSFPLPGLTAGQVFGVAMGTEIRLVVRDNGSWMDPRDMNDWWRIRPGS